MSEKKTFEVSGPDGTPYTVGFQTKPKHQATWNGLLAGWHATDQTIRCLCRTANPVQLVIRKYDSGKLLLARHPNTGPRHDPRCRYFGPSISGAIASAYLPAAVEDADGVYKVQLSVGRRMQDPRGDAPPVEGRPPASTGALRRGTLTPLGLLALLWEIAALNQYRPSWAATRAKPASVSGLLLSAATGVRWGRASLADSLQVGSARKPPTETKSGPEKVGKEGGLAKHNERVAEAASKSRSRMVVIGLLKAHVRNGQPTGVDLAAGERVPFAGWGCTHPMLTEAHWGGLQRSFNRELRAWRKGGPTYAIAIVEPKEYGSSFDLVQIALMRVSPRAIPLDSGHEAEVEDALVAAGRSFVKPMRYAAGDDTLPDFELLDVAHPPLPMEVFGLNSPEYAKRMQEKVAHYDQKHGPGGWWRWDAFSGGEMPIFPPAAGAGSNTLDEA